MRVPAIALCALLALTVLALAQEQEDVAASFSRIEGGAVFDYKMGVDGSAVSERFTLTHVVCSDGSKSLRVMLPVAPEDDATVFDMAGPKSTLKKIGDAYQAVFLASGQRIRKTMELKPVNDARSMNPRQFVIRLDYGSPLWKALTSGKQDGARMLIGQGGMPVEIPADPKLKAALKSCGFSA